MTYNKNLTALHKGLTPIHPDQDRLNFAPKLAGGIKVLLADGVSCLTFNNLYDSAYDSSEEGIAAGKTYIPALDGTIWTISDIQGWWNLTDSEIPNIERGFGDGSFDITGRLLSRDLTITGSILIAGPSTRFAITNKQLVSGVATLITGNSAHGYSVGQTVLVTGVDSTFDGSYVITGTTNTSFTYSTKGDDVVSTSSTGYASVPSSISSSIATKSKIVREQLLDAFNLVKRGTWLIVNEDNEYQRACYVRLSGKPEVSTVNSRGRIDFSIGLRAPNPTKVEWFPISAGGEIPEGFAVSDGNAYQNLKILGGTSYYRNYPTGGSYSGIAPYTNSKAYSKSLTKLVDETPVFGTPYYQSGDNTINIPMYGTSTSPYTVGNSVYVSNITYTGTFGTSTTNSGYLGPFTLLTGSNTTLIKYTPPSGTTGVTAQTTLAVSANLDLRLYASYASSTITITSVSSSTATGASSVKDGDYIDVSGLTYRNSGGTVLTSGVSGPFLVNGSTTTGGATIKYAAPSGTASVTGTPIVRTVPRVSAAYASNTITLTLNDATSTVKDGDYINVTGLTYTSATGSTTGPFMVTGSTVYGGSTIKYTAPTGTTAVSGTPAVSIQEYRNYSSTGYYPIDDSTNNSLGKYRYYPNQTTDNTNSGRFSIYNYGTTNVPCYIRFVGPLYGPAILKNTTTNQKINILYTSNLGGQVLGPSTSASVSTIQFLDIDTYTREVHKGDYLNGIYSSSSRGSLSPLVDWIHLQPGINDFYYEDYGASNITGRIEIYWRSGWDR